MRARRSHPRKAPIPATSGVGTASPFEGCPHPPANDDMPIPSRRPAYDGRTFALLVVARLLLGAGGTAIISVGTSLDGCGR
jgi:hypothetical protein